MLNYNTKYPHFIKYMGSKSNILDFVMSGINEAYIENSTIVDLFSGSATLAGALRGHAPVISNDIQVYSAVLAEAYLNDYDWGNENTSIDKIVEAATSIYKELLIKHNIDPDTFVYHDKLTLEEFRELEEKQKSIIEIENWKSKYYLFAKYYSGTYWSYDQCVWIDAYRAVADQYKNTPMYSAILTALMFAMSYNAQSTGHYAQYRDANNDKSMRDILIYRKKLISPLVKRKLEEIRNNMSEKHLLGYKNYAVDFKDCLKEIPEYSTVYADPPYCFVHYSRFYHAIETLIKYDYPEVKHKGRYREDRHQSPFCIKTQVSVAFKEMFALTAAKKSNLVLSYSNTGMITLDEISEIAEEQMNNYELILLTKDYQHSTMGRRIDKSVDVQEALIIMKRKGE